MGRCFRCLSRGHLAGQCKGPDRSKCCRRCGITGHRAAKCEATTKVAKEFATQLDNGRTEEALRLRVGERSVQVQ